MNTMGDDLAPNLQPSSQRGPSGSSRRPIATDGTPSSSMRPPQITPRPTKRARAPDSEEENDENAHIAPRPQKHARVHEDDEDAFNPSQPQPEGQLSGWAFLDPPQGAPA